MDDLSTPPALVRRKTLERLEDGTGDMYSEWFQPPKTHLKVLGSTCTQVRDEHFSKLSRKEKEEAMKNCEPKDLEESLSRLKERYRGKKKRWEKDDTILEGFVNFALAFTGLFNSVLQIAPPEYRAAFSVVTFIYKGVKEKSDRDEKLSNFLQSIIQMISQKEFYHNAIKTPKMQTAFLAFCTAIVKFVIAADRLSAKLYVVKLLLASAPNDPLQPYYENIKQCADTIDNLQTAASLALLLEERAKTEEIAKGSISPLSDFVLIKLYEHSTAPPVTPEASAIIAFTRYKAIHRCQKLADILLPVRYDPIKEKDFNDGQRIHLADRDLWEYHTSEIQFQEWQNQDPRPLFWLSGPESYPNGPSWVSSFSVDLLDALSLNESLEIAYVFCSNDWEQVWTPALVLKRLIVQVLQSFHQIVISNVSILSTRRFNELGSDSWEAQNLFFDILAIVQDILLQQGKELYIIIDRLDLCRKDNDEEFTVKDHLIPLLQNLSLQFRATRVVLTSTVKANGLETLKKEKEVLKNVWIDTKSARSMDDPSLYNE